MRGKDPDALEQWIDDAIDTDLAEMLRFAKALHRDIDALAAAVAAGAGEGDQVVVMSNGGFGGIHQKLLAQLASPSQ